ncbi:MAG TPA: SLC13 family permease [Candidatus Paceibacterota bacterium]|nr:SLC13 family permease [Candidatus Paceibacterota bacterium]HRZ56138.1 SLC13 family permease [Candidatus Paceibacterota bacterium]
MTAALLVLAILTLATVLLVTEWVAMEVTALLVLGAVTVTGLVTPREAVAGFSNPAVVTIWAVYILSGGLSRTGVASRLGRHVLRLAGRSEMRIVTVVMLSAGVLSAFMNNIAVVALMLPVVMDIARRTGQPPSRLLMPLALGSLLGGLTTLLGTATNLLVSEMMHEQAGVPFRLFDFTPVGVSVMLAGVTFVVFIGRRLLPRRDISDASAATPAASLLAQYQLGERLFRLRVPAESPVADKTLAEVQINHVLDVQVVGIRRSASSELAPGPKTALRVGDVLLVRGRQERLQELAGWRLLADDDETPVLKVLLAESFELAEIQVADNTDLAGKSVRQVGFHERFGATLLGLRRGSITVETRLTEEVLQPGDTLLVHGPRAAVHKLSRDPQFRRAPGPSAEKLVADYNLVQRLLVLRLPSDSNMAGQDVQSAGLGHTAELRILAVLRQDGAVLPPRPGLKLAEGDRLLALGTRPQLELVRALAALTFDPTPPDVDAALETEHVGLLEAVLAPRSALAGKRVPDAQLRERFGVSLLALWRGGRSYRSQLRAMDLRHGDALLFYGPRERLQALGREPDFVVLTEAAQELPRARKAPLALAILGVVVLAALLGWLPIYIAAVLGAAMMVATGCLRMDEAYRFIEWKAVFLIAGLLPLGIAANNSGAALWLGENLAGWTAPLGPVGILAALMGVTFAASAVLPPAAVVVMLAPVVMHMAAHLQLSPRALMMGMAVAAASTFINPLGRAASLMVMGPGGYRFVDYVKVGLPLTLVVWLVTVGVLPLVWPLSTP